jgi:hypothetical protein
MVLTFQVSIFKLFFRGTCQGLNPVSLSIRGRCPCFVTRYVLQNGVVNPTPNSHYLLVWSLSFVLSGLGDPASSYATTGIARRITGTRKPPQHDKVETPSRRLSVCEEGKTVYSEAWEVIASVVKLCDEDSRRKQLTFPLTCATDSSQIHGCIYCFN